MSTVESEASVQAASPLALLLEQAREIIARYPEGRQRSALLPLLHLVQSRDGYVTPEGVAFCADLLGLSRAQVAAVATFYTMYKRRPTGDFLVSVCTNTMCDVLGGREVYETLTEHLGVGHDETTEDGSITLEHAECLAACDYGPVMTVNYEFFDGIEPDEAVRIVEQLRAGQRPMPTRGARLCTLKEMAVQLAGYADERPDAVGDAVAGAPTLRGNRLAERHGVTVAGYDPSTPIPTHAQREAAKVARPHPKFAEPAGDRTPGDKPAGADAPGGPVQPQATAPDTKPAGLMPDATGGTGPAEDGADTRRKGAEATQAATDAAAGLDQPRNTTAQQAQRSTADSGEEAGS